MAIDSYIPNLAAVQNRIQSFSFVIAVLAGVLLIVWFGRLVRPDSTAVVQLELDSRINPNNAPIASLVRLPRIGTGLAQAVVSYRENFDEQQNGKVAFEDCDDLQRVKGIGPKTAKNIRRWLKFE